MSKSCARFTFFFLCMSCAGLRKYLSDDSNNTLNQSFELTKIKFTEANQTFFIAFLKVEI